MIRFVRSSVCIAAAAVAFAIAPGAEAPRVYAIKGAQARHGLGRADPVRHDRACRTA